MSQPYISVIIPTYNRQLQLAECLESIYRQHDDALQIIIVNDCGESIARIGDLYPELDITIVDLQHNSKHVVARNRGLEEVQADLIMLCDDDDVLLPGHIERMRDAITDADLVYTDAEIVDYVIKDQERVPIHRRLFAYDDDVAGMRKFSTFIASGCLFRKQLLSDIGNFDIDVRNYWDWDFYLRAVKRHRVRRVPVASVLYAFSAQGGNMSSQLDQMRTYLDRLSIKHQLGELPTKNFYLLLDEPEIKQREAVSQIIWDFTSMRSRLPGLDHATV